MKISPPINKAEEQAKEEEEKEEEKEEKVRNKSEKEVPATCTMTSIRLRHSLITKRTTKKTKCECGDTENV